MRACVCIINTSAGLDEVYSESFLVSFLHGLYSRELTLGVFHTAALGVSFLLGQAYLILLSFTAIAFFTNWRFVATLR